MKSVAALEKRKAYQKAYREKNSEYLKSLKKDWYYKNQQSALAYGRAYRAQNVEARRERGRANYRENAEKYRQQAREYRKLNPEKHRAAVHKYQGRPEPTRPRPSACEACGRTPRIALDLDHCHSSGKFRGWLCGHCNRALGMMKDSPIFLRALAAYVERHGGSIS